MGRVSLTFTAANLAALRAVAGNAALLDSAECAERNGGREGSIPWVVGGFAVSTHPDLVEWTAQLAAAAGASLQFICGRPAIVASDGRVLGWGRGTHDFVIRAAPGSIAAIEAQRGRIDERYGAGWRVFPAFLPGVPRAHHESTIVGWLREVQDA